MPALLLSAVLLLSAPPAEATGGDGFTPGPEFQAWLGELVREHLPHQYEKKDGWGRTARTWDGLKVELDGFKLETRRRWKESNDGTWKRYRIDLLHPDQLEIRLSDIRSLAGDQVALRLSAVADLHLTGQIAQWEHGVQLYSLSAEADARVELTADALIALKLDPKQFPPDLLVQPKVEQADLRLIAFKMRRVGQAEGPLVRSLSNSIQNVLEDKLADNRRKLTESINKQLTKKQDKLRFSPRAAIESEWKKWLPAKLQPPSTNDSKPKDQPADR